MLKNVSLLVIMFAVLLLASTHTAQTILSVGQDAPAFRASALDGNEFGSEDLLGKIVVLTFWSTTCEICRSEFPKYNEMVQANRGRDVVFLAPTMHDATLVESYLRKNRLDATVLPNSFGLLLQFADRDPSGHLNMGFPAYYVVGPTGKIEYRGSGFGRTQAIQATISKILKG